VIIFEHMNLYNLQGDLTPASAAASIDRAAIRRPGRDVTLITYGASLHKCLAAAEQLAAQGVEAEVIDLRVLRPLDEATFVASVQRTHRAVVVDEGWRSVGLSAEVGMRIMERAFYELDAPVQRVCSVEAPVPYSKHMEEAALPQVAQIVSAVKGMLAHVQ
ncbi:MAG TPA: transketolase C-terminal domain-containing protein, partial [Steroidobacter sp.]|nr:transketolase C-terminal domain-containing protein [Steroidobacter sp.]